MRQVRQGQVRCRCGRCGRCGKYARCASAASVAGAARVASAAGLAARGIIWLPETSHMASYCCWQAALWYYMAARDKPYGIIGGYGSRMFFSRFHNAWLTVSGASVQCPPANRPADASCRSLVGMGAECSSRVSTMHGQLYRTPWRSTGRLPGRSTLYANHWWVWEQNVLLAFPQCMANCVRGLGAMPAS